MKILHPFQLTATSAVLAGVTASALTGRVLTRTAHGLNTGDPFIPTFTGGFEGLTPGDRYYAIRVDADTFRAAASLAAALAGDAIDITSDGAGASLGLAAPFSPTPAYVLSGLFSPLAEINAFPAYIGCKNSNGNADPRTPVAVAVAHPVEFYGFDLGAIFVLTAPGDGVDFLGFE